MTTPPLSSDKYFCDEKMGLGRESDLFLDKSFSLDIF